MEKAVADQIERTGARRVGWQFQLHPVVARQPLILSDAEAVQVLRIEFANHAADIASGIVPGAREGPGLRRQIES